MKSDSRLRVFATTSSPAEAGRIMGLKVAVRGFFRSLIRQGVFEKHVFFAQTNQPQRAKERIVQGLGLDSSEAGRVELAPLRELPERLATGGIDVLSRADCRINQYMNLRGVARKECLAVFSGVTHSLNSAEEYAHLAEMLLLSPTAKDALVCTSSAAEAVLSGAFNRIREGVPALARAPSPRLARIPLGIEEAPPQADREKTRKDFGLEPGHVAIVYVGRIHSLVKADLRPFIRIFAEVQKARPEARLFIAGGAEDKDPTEMDLLKREIAAMELGALAQVIPNISEERKQQLLSAADIFLSPVDNFQETFGLSIVEAMQAGLPVICSDWGGYRDLVEDGVTGFLLPTASFGLPRHDAFFNPHFGYIPLELSQSVFVDLEASRKALLRLVADPGLRGSMGEKGRERSAAYAWPAVIARYRELWEELRALPPAAPGPRLELPQAELFSSYMSRTLGDDARFSLPAKGESVYHVPPPHPFLAGTLDVKAMEFVLKSLQESGGSSVALMAARGVWKIPELRLAASYLLKHGVIKLA